MKIYFERSGGFLGRRNTASIDTNQLAADDAQIILDMVDAADFFNLPETIETKNFIADQYDYKIYIDSGDQNHEVTVRENALPDTLRPLVQHLTVLLRSADK